MAQTTAAVRHYAAAMESRMIHHYPLQAHLYLVACIVICLAARATTERHLGGYVYVFLRGMPAYVSSDRTTPRQIVGAAPRKRVLALDRLLHEGTATGSN